jgi:hypothetical protein
MHRFQVLESYDRHVDRRADELAAEAEPVAVVDDELILVCRECRGTGTVRHPTGWGLADWIEESCRWCKGTGAAERYPIGREVPPAA